MNRSCSTFEKKKDIGGEWAGTGTAQNHAPNDTYMYDMHCEFDDYIKVFVNDDVVDAQVLAVMANQSVTRGGCKLTLG